ncbi:hypothetical protein AXF42_Ash010373 [Apostasia shenzhenica]|uniref:BSD domain-containing protein n=1 Tax=Apostasia shenzhenica TaxID=1088818 RepID=A0A2I0BDV6_9ASPA|nr:hypothetical protein AXF42_Ash010373 [Apostasia shenzhenica]
MSWLARSLVNSLRGDDDGGSRDPSTKVGIAGRSPGEPPQDDAEDQSDSDPLSPSRGVKEDLSELTKTITRQFWGVASFLAPPPSNELQQADRILRPDVSDPADDGDSVEMEVVNSPRLAGIRSDLAELGGRFKSGISMLSNTKAVSEISKIASTFLPFGDDEEEGEEEEGKDDRKPHSFAVGINEEVLLFVRNISMHPETWLDFPLIAEDEDSDDFELSDSQQEHALAVERLEPRLAALRIELCPVHMSEGCFWKIYFVLLHSRLNKLDAELLSTPQIVEARASLLQDLQSRTKPSIVNEDSLKSSSCPRDNDAENSPSTIISVPVADFETEKHPVDTNEIKMVDKSVIKEEYREVVPVKVKDEGDEDDWLADESGDANGSVQNAIPLGNEEDVSFSDLEEDDDQRGEGDGAMKAPKSTESQAKDSKGWVQLSSTSTQNKDSNDWLNVDEFDVE